MCKQGGLPVNRIDILIVVDVAGALAAGGLMGYVYLVDTNKYIGSWNEGQSTLNTVCQDGTLLTWSVASVDPGDDVSIAGFSGPMIDSKICQPKSNPIAGDGAWSGFVETQGQFAPFPYTVTLDMQSQQQGFAATVKVV